ncbi:hypothetical protein [Staphylococcus gallinarum]|nr:hypothetical protein [Staphylococcus gallinarum]
MTNLYEHFNLWFLMLLAIVAGTLINYLVDFIFILINKFPSSKSK